MTTTEDEVRLHHIRSLFGEMPYGGMAHFEWTRRSVVAGWETPTLAEVEANLVKLRDVLQRVAHDDQARLTELDAYRRAASGARAALEAVAGIDPTHQRIPTDTDQENP